jgi:HSP20 family protein
MVDREQQRFHGLFDAVAELNRMREFWRAGVDPPQQEGRTHATAWIPRMDIFASGDDLVIRCELSGVARDEVDISFEHDTLTIFGERTGAPDEDGTTYYVRERHYGAFRRTINLPEGTDSGSVRAALEDGLLEITVAGGCRRRREPERIDIAVAGEERR